MQKNSYKVPWADKSEWLDVRKKIYSDNVEDVIEAYETMTMWQLRSSNIPAYVDCTAGILQVMVQEHLDKRKILNDYDLRLSYSTALIRFVNHVHTVSDFKKDSLYRSAKTQNIPDWLITMRHDAAHGQVLPSLEIFHFAAKVSLKWLLENYWFQEEKCIKNLGANHFEDEITMTNLNISLLPIFKSFIKVWETCSQLIKNSLKHMSHLSNEHLFHIKELIHMCQTNESLQKNGLNCVIWLTKIMKSCDTPERQTKKKILTTLRCYIVELLQSITYDNPARYTLVQSILQSDYMLDTKRKDWESLIHLLQHLKCLTLFLESLFELAGNDNDMAVNLLDYLLPSIKALKAMWSIYKDFVKSEKGMAMQKKMLKKTMFVRYKRKCKNLHLRLRLKKPPKIKFEMLQNLLSNPTRRSCNLALKCLSLVEPPLPQDLHGEIELLIGIYCGGVTFMEDSPEESKKIYTLEDLEMLIANKGTEDEDDVGNNANSIWVKSDASAEIWSHCPLGLLPHQEKVDCNLPKGVKWEVEQPQKDGKRTSSTLLTCHAESVKKLKKSLEIVD